MMRVLSTTLALALPASVHAHASLIIPTSRNAIDRLAPGFTVDGHGLRTPCTCADRGTGCAQGIPNGQCPPGLGAQCASGSNKNVRAEGGAGQPCLWWSQGCSIGCKYCLTDPKHPDNQGKIPTKAITGNPPHADKAGFRKSYCDAPTTKSVLPKEYWTMNIHAAEGAVNDSCAQRASSSLHVSVFVCAVIIGTCYAQTNLIHGGAQNIYQVLCR